MTTVSMDDLQESVRDKIAFNALADYLTIGRAFLTFIGMTSPTRIISPSHPNHIFYQYSESYGYKITRPLNIDLFFESSEALEGAFARFVSFLGDLHRHQTGAAQSEGGKRYLESREINQVVYTIQQAVGCIGDSFEDANQSRKRVGRYSRHW